MSCDFTSDEQVEKQAKAIEWEVRNEIMELRAAFFQEHGKNPVLIKITDSFDRRIRASMVEAKDLVMGMEIKHHADKLEVS